MPFFIFRRYFPCAIGLYILDDRELVDANFAEFVAGFESPALIDGMRSPAVTRGKGILRLKIYSHDQRGITDAAFVNLRGIYILYMYECNDNLIRAAITQGLYVIY